MRFSLDKINNLKGLWPVVAGISFSWFLTGFWASPFTSHKPATGPVQQVSSGGGSQDIILQRNVLGLDNPVPQANVAGPDPSGWKLLGVFSGARPMALLFIDGKSKTFVIGEQEGGWTLESVHTNSVVFKSGGTERTLQLFKEGVAASPVTKSSKNKIALSKLDVVPTLSDPGNLLQQALFKPSIEGGKTNGYRITNIQPSSLLSLIGFQNGDVVTRINGEIIDGPAKMMQLYSGLQSAQAVNLDIKRGSENISLVVELN